MKIIKPYYEIYDQDWSLKGIFRAIERAGRTCYKSVGTRYFRLENDPKNEKEQALIEKAKNDKNVVCKQGPFFDDAYYISIPNKFIKDYDGIEECWEESYEDSSYYENLTADSFVEMLSKNGHTAMLEHGTVYLECSEDIAEKYFDNKYTFVEGIPTGEFYQVGSYQTEIYKYYITTNYRVIFENEWFEDLIYLCEPTEFHKRRVTVKFTCNRQVSHEFVRHRVFSFAQESTRYCNYSLNKFGNELTFIEPCWLTEEIIPNKENLPELQAKAEFYEYLGYVEDTYFKLIEYGWQPQQAATVLPNTLKTELVMTGFIDDWKHFFKLRADTHAHPQAQELAYPLLEEFKNRELI